MDKHRHLVPRSDEGLVHRFGKGDNAACEILLDRCRHVICAIARSVRSSSSAVRQAHLPGRSRGAAFPHSALLAGPFPPWPRLLRPSLRYYGLVRLPTSAQRRAPVIPRTAPPAATNPLDPVGPPGSRKRRCVREVVYDPGGATPSRLTTAHMLPSL